MVDHTEKWDNYDPKNTKWIDKNTDHPCREYFINQIGGDVESILEIGGGALIEAKLVRGIYPDMRYAIMDVSKGFLDYCRECNFECHEGDMVDMPFSYKEFDMTYMSSVIEHSPDVHQTLSEMARVSKGYRINMFKWNMRTGGLKSNFKEKKQCFSTAFNIDNLLNLLGYYGHWPSADVCIKDTGEIVSFGKYRMSLPDDLDYHRNGNYLSLSGEWR